MKHITRGLMPFWDEYLTDTRHTDAVLSVNHPQREDIVLEFDKPWEREYTGAYLTVVHGEDKYMMYYEVHSPNNRPGEPVRYAACYAESSDGIHWVKPELGLIEYDGSTATNIIIDGLIDNITVLRDENPDCPPEYRYKAILECVGDAPGYANPFDKEETMKLLCMVSADGIHFEKHCVVSQGFAYDSQNTLYWNPTTGRYNLFLRDMQCWPEDPTATTNDRLCFRAVRVSESEDFVHWTEPVELDYFGGDRFQMYTNGISPYPLDNRYYIGFATRYIERREWTKNYDHLCGAAERRERMEREEPREGLAVTDCVFMSSRDAYHWYRFDEACLAAGIETGHNWVYGDCYPMLGLLLSPSRFENEPDVLSLYVNNRYKSSLVTQMVRYSFRQDGFASYKADAKWHTLKTVPFTFDGEALRLNFRTSARGSIYLSILNAYGQPLEGYKSCEIFGDALDRTVDFDRSLSELAGKPVCFEFTMRETELYAMRFE